MPKLDQVSVTKAQIHELQDITYLTECNEKEMLPSYEDATCKKSCQNETK